MQIHLEFARISPDDDWVGVHSGRSSSLCYRRLVLYIPYVVRNIDENYLLVASCEKYKTLQMCYIIFSLGANTKSIDIWNKYLVLLIIRM